MDSIKKLASQTGFLRKQIIVIDSKNERLDKDLQFKRIHLSLLEQSTKSIQQAALKNQGNQNPGYEWNIDQSSVNPNKLANYSWDNLLPDPHKMLNYGSLIKALQPRPIIQAKLYSLIPPSDSSSILPLVFSLYSNLPPLEKQQHLLKVFDSLLPLSFDNVKSVHDLLRSMRPNSPFSKWCSYYVNQDPDHEEYLHNCFKDCLSEIMDKEDSEEMKQFEISRERLVSKLDPLGQSPETLDSDVSKIIERSIDLLVESLDSLVNAMLINFTNVPYGIRYICIRLKQYAIHRFGNGTALDGSLITIVSFFFFLRFVNPAVISPHRFGIIGESCTGGDNGDCSDAPGVHSQKLLTLIAKILLLLTSNTTQRDSGMDILIVNPHVGDIKEKLNGFLGMLCDEQIPFYPGMGRSTHKKTKSSASTSASISQVISNHIDNINDINNEENHDIGDNNDANGPFNDKIRDIGYIPLQINQIYTLHSLLSSNMSQFLIYPEFTQIHDVLIQLGNPLPLLPKMADFVVKVPVLDDGLSLIKSELLRDGGRVIDVRNSAITIKNRSSWEVELGKEMNGLRMAVKTVFLDVPSATFDELEKLDSENGNGDNDSDEIPDNSTINQKLKLQSLLEILKNHEGESKDLPLKIKKLDSFLNHTILPKADVLDIFESELVLAQTSLKRFQYKLKYLNHQLDIANRLSDKLQKQINSLETRLNTFGSNKEGEQVNDVEFASPQTMFISIFEKPGHNNHTSKERDLLGVSDQFKPIIVTLHQLQTEDIILETRLPASRQPQIFFKFFAPYGDEITINMYYGSRKEALISIDLSLEDLIDLSLDNFVSIIEEVEKKKTEVIPPSPEPTTVDMAGSPTLPHFEQNDEPKLTETVNEERSTFESRSQYGTLNKPFSSLDGSLKNNSFSDLFSLNGRDISDGVLDLQFCVFDIGNLFDFLCSRY